MSLFKELKRRNVFRVGVAYIVASWVILQVADLVFEAINAPDWVLQAMLAVIVIGFLVALVIAWAYEVTPDGIKRESEIDRSASITTETADKLNRITIVLLVLVAVLVIADRFFLAQPTVTTVESPGVEMVSNPAPVAEPAPEVTTTDENSVAVLPFVNMSSDPEQEFFSDGISEEILNVLTRIPNLKVAARTSSFQFKGQNLDVADIARQLKVNHVLEGSVRKAGDQLRITAQLIEAESGFHLWSDTFDRKLVDVFAIQDEIAGAIAQELRARLSDDPITSSTVVDVEAYQLYLKGLGLVATRKEDDLFAAFEVLQAALEIEPEYVPAMATLARGYVVAPYFTDRATSAELREQSRSWAAKALQLEPDNAEALSVMGIVANERDKDSDRALQLLRQAAQINPGSLAVNNFLGDVLFRTGNLDEAIIYESRAAEIDPLAPVHLSDLAFVYQLTGDYDKVIDLSERALQRNPVFPNAQQNMLEAFWALGDPERLENAIRSQIDAGGLNEWEELALSARVDLASGNTAQARQKLLSAYEFAKSTPSVSVGVAFEAVIQGDFDIAGEMLLQAYASEVGNWSFPLYVRLPEQAPDSKPWQEFWSLPEAARLAEIRRKNGIPVHFPQFGSAGRP